jgi:hypothetical protein
MVSLVCRCWGEIAFSKLFMEDIRLNLVKVNNMDPNLEMLEDSKRAYKDIPFFDPTMSVEKILRVLQKFGCNMTSLRFSSYLEDYPELLECLHLVPNIRKLRFNCDMRYRRPIDEAELPVIPHLTTLYLYGDFESTQAWASLLKDLVEIAPNVIDFTIHDYGPLSQEVELCHMTFVTSYRENLRRLEISIVNNSMGNKLAELRFPNLQELVLYTVESCSSQMFKNLISSLSLSSLTLSVNKCKLTRFIRLC